MNYTEPQRVTQELMDELRRISPYDPDHLPAEIELIEAFRQRHPKLSQVACFDTAFHRTMPRVARLLPIPRRFDAMGIQRYGFHGLSYAYLVEELDRVAGPAAAQGRVILAHLGNGASLAAIREGKSIDTSMEFTPAAGLPMGTRTGDLDPGVAWYMMRSGNLTPKQFNNLINHNSGLLGVSESSSDMRDLIQRQASDYPRRRSCGAVLLPNPQVDRGVRSRAWRFGHARVCRRHRRERWEVRARVCSGLQFLGVELDEAGNAANAPVISTESSRLTVRVILTDEELMIARNVRRLQREEGETKENGSSPKSLARPRHRTRNSNNSSNSW